MTLREQFEKEVSSKGTKMLFETSNQNYIKWLEQKVHKLMEGTGQRG